MKKTILQLFFVAISATSSFADTVIPATVGQVERFRHDFQEKSLKRAVSTRQLGS